MRLTCILYLPVPDSDHEMKAITGSSASAAFVTSILGSFVILFSFVDFVPFIT